MPKATKQRSPAKSRRNARGQFQSKPKPHKTRKPRRRPHPAGRRGDPTPSALTDRERIFVEHALFYHLDTIADIAPLLAMKPAPGSIFEPWTERQCGALLESPTIQAELKSRREKQELANAQLRAEIAQLAPHLGPALIDGKAVHNLIESPPGTNEMTRALEFAERRLRDAGMKAPENKAELLERLAQLAALPTTQTNDSITGQVSALQLMAKAQGWIVERYQDITDEAKGKTIEEQEFFCQHGYWPKHLGGQ